MALKDHSHLPPSTAGPLERASTVSQDTATCQVEAIVELLQGDSLLRSPYHDKGSASAAAGAHAPWQLIQEHLKEMFGIIYVIQNYSRRFCKPEGCFLNIFNKDRIDDNLAQFGDADDIDYIVVSDGEEEYDALVDELVKSASMLFPKAYLHFEDFGLTNAHRILYLYRPGVACVNDDVRGTGCVTLTAIMVGLHVSKLKLTDMQMHNLALKDSDKRLLLDVVDVREIGVKIPVALIKQAVGERLSRLEDIPTSDEDLEELVRVQMMDPVYRPLVKLTGEKATKLARGEVGLGGAGWGK